MIINVGSLIAVIVAGIFIMFGTAVLIGAIIFHEKEEMKKLTTFNNPILEN